MQSNYLCVWSLHKQEADGDPTGEAAQVAQQTLTFYELDLGLNHVVRKYSEPLEDTANFLLAVPGGNDGPSGVLLACENYLVYKNFGDQPDLRCPIPRRQHDLDDAERSILFVSSATHKTKVRHHIFCCTLYQEKEREYWKKQYLASHVSSNVGSWPPGAITCLVIIIAYKLPNYHCTMRYR